MMKVLTSRMHGFIDYAVVALFLLAPTLFGFDGTPQTLSYVFAAVHLVMSVLTAYPLGVLKIIPFPIHGVVEAVVIPTLAALPWVVGFSEVTAARNFFLVAAALVAVVVICTNYKAADQSTQRQPARA